MAYRGTAPVREKIVINSNQCVGEVSHFSYLGNDDSFDKDYNTDCKLHNFRDSDNWIQIIWRVIKRIFRKNLINNVDKK